MISAQQMRLLLRMARDAETAAGTTPTDVRRTACAMFVALCAEHGLDKDAALIELGTTIDEYEALRRRLGGETLQ